MESTSLSVQKNSESHKQEKIDKLLDLFYSIINNDRYRHEFSLLMDKFNIFEDDLTKAFLTYNLDIFAFDNSIFDTIENRFVLYIHNLIKGSWHQERQATIVDILVKLRPQSIIDLGFGIPSRYVQELGLQQKLFNVTLCDYCDSALNFAEALLEIWGDNWRTTISLTEFDLNQAELAGAHDVYLFQDSIEHVEDPTKCLKKYVATTPKEAKFIFSLPIGDIIPAHYIEWLTDIAAIKWLESCGLEVVTQKLVYVNLDVDLFAEPLGKNHHNLIVLAEKMENKWNDSKVFSRI